MISAKMKSQVQLWISFLDLSFLSMKNNDSYSVDVEQIKREKKEKKTATKKKKNKKCGRPSGSKNKNKSIIKSTYLLELVDKMISNLKNTHDAFFKELRIQHFVADGAYGNNNWVLMLEKYDLKLVSKLHHNSALYLPYTGKYFGRGRPKKYGKKIDINNISFSYLVKTTDDKKNSYIQYIYQIKVLSKNFRDKLNVVIIVRIDRKTGRQANVILFSNDLELSAQKIIDIYSLRFQIEFNFRDAKQFFGLADFKNIKEKQVLNAINLSLFMTLISKILLQKYRIFFDNKKLSINDLKSLFRALMYISKIFKNDKEKAISILNSQEQLNEILEIGLINGNLAS
jgi:putative transposase